MKRRVVITGQGVVTSLDSTVKGLWEKILDGQSGIHEIRLFDIAPFKVRIGGDVYDFEPPSNIEKREVKKLDRFTLFAMAAANDAVNESGIDFQAEQQERCGAVIGSGIGGLGMIEEQMRKLVDKGPNKVSPFTVPKMMLNAAGGNIAIQHGMRGPNYSVATACASATNAMGDAFKLIQCGAADVMLTGGTEAAMTPMGLSAFQNMRALSDLNEEPHKASRPFDSERKGFVFSEGAGMLIFEEFERAKSRGANIIAEVVGFGTSCDAGHITAPDAQGLGAARAMELALKDAQIDGSKVDYINAHGTSTPLGDKAETIAVKSVFGSHAYDVAISSTKSQLGHSLGASGGIELVITSKAVKESVIPQTINLENPDPDCDLDYTPLQAKEKQLNYAMSNSFGFGGHNASIVIAKV